MLCLSRTSASHLARNIRQELNLNSDVEVLQNPNDDQRDKRKKNRQKDKGEKNRKGEKRKSKKRRRESSSSDQSDTESLPSSSRRGKTSRKKKRKEMSPSSQSDTDPSSSESEEDNSNWSRINEVWDKDSRPRSLQNKNIVNAMSMQEIYQLHSMYVHNEKSATKDATAKQDEIPGKVSFKAQMDDGIRKLHPARWLRLPFSEPSTYFNQVPVRHTKKYRNLSLEFSGASNKISDRVILNMHDRRHCLELKHLLSENTNVASRPIKEIRRQEKEGVVSFQDYGWEEPQSMRQVLEAIENYRTILTLLWPADQTGNIIGRLLLKYKNIQAASDPKVKVAVVTAYFDKVQRANTRRAANRTVILSYDEHEKLLKETLSSFGLRSEVPYEGGLR